MSNPPHLPPQARVRALANVRAEIARTLVSRARWDARARQEEAAGLDSGWARGMVDIADERLAQLRRSVEVLTDGEEGPSGDEPGGP